MKLHELHPAEGSTTAAKRLGRGVGGQVCFTPYFASASFLSCTQVSRCATSATTAMLSPPLALISALNCSTCGSISTMTTFAPSWQKSSDALWQMPPAAPVMMATFPLSLSIILSSSVCRRADGRSGAASGCASDRRHI